MSQNKESVLKSDYKMLNNSDDKENFPSSNFSTGNGKCQKSDKYSHSRLSKIPLGGPLQEFNSTEKQTKLVHNYQKFLKATVISETLSSDNENDVLKVSETVEKTVSLSNKSNDRKSEVSHVDTSFELMLNSLISPVTSVSNKSSSSSQATNKGSNDLTFEEFMNKILTPDINEPVSLKIIQDNSQKMLQEIKGNSEAKKSLYVDSQHQKEEHKKPEGSAQQSISVAKKCIHSTTHFMQPLVDINMDSQIQNREVQIIHNSIKPPEMENVSSQDILQTQMSQPQSTITNKSYLVKLSGCLFPMKLDLTQQSDLSNYEDINCADSQMEITPCEDSQETDISTVFERDSKEISTQTSFDFLSPPVSPILGRNRIRRRDRKTQTIKKRPRNKKANLPSSVCVLELLNTENTDHEFDTSNRCEELVDDNISLKNEHILELLSEDVTNLPDGRKFFNNIGKIGTEKWLESAVALINRSPPVKKIKVDIFEAENSSSLYIDFMTEVSLDYSNRGTTKICKIKRITKGVMETSKMEVDNEFIDEISDTENLTQTQQKLRLAIDNICKCEHLLGREYKEQEIDKSKIRIKIHNIFARLYEVFENNQHPILKIKKLEKVKGCLKNGRVEYEHSGFSSLNLTSKISQLFFCRTLYLLGKIYLLLSENTKLTKRELFYQVKRVVKRQSRIERCISSISNLLGVGSWCLNIVANSGLVYGDLKLFWESEEVTNCNLPATLIPNDLENIVEVQTNASFILVVEKESIFHKLLQEDLPNKLARPFIMITGKGVAALNTRLFLNKISRMMSLPVFILADADVYGIRIMLYYRFGSQQYYYLSDDLAVPNARWLGVFPSEISKFGMKYQQLTKRDKSIVQATLKNSFLEGYPKITEELEILLKSNKKGSIEGLIKNDTFLSETYLPLKFFNQDFI